MRLSELPIAPAPQRAELIGSWLLRVASIYAISVPRLLVHLGIEAPPISTLHWSRLPRFVARDIAKLAHVMNWPSSAIRRMQSRVGRMRQPEELGICLACWREDITNDRPIYWRRYWVDPLALSCPQHRGWLLPVRVANLRRIRTYGDLIDFAQHMICEHSGMLTFGQSSSPSRDLLVLERALCKPTHNTQIPFGDLGLSSAPMLFRVISDLLHLAFLYVEGTDTLGWVAQQVHAKIPEIPPIKRSVFEFRHRNPPPILLTLPHHLRSRQALFAYLATLFSFGSESFIDPSRLPLTEYRRLASFARQWPMSFTEALIPELAEWIRADILLLEKFKCSPRYFEERHRLGFPY